MKINSGYQRYRITPRELRSGYGYTRDGLRCVRARVRYGKIPPAVNPCSTLSAAQAAAAASLAMEPIKDSSLCRAVMEYPNQAIWETRLRATVYPGNEDDTSSLDAKRAQLKDAVNRVVAAPTEEVAAQQ